MDLLNITDMLGIGMGLLTGGFLKASLQQGAGPTNIYSGNDALNDENEAASLPTISADANMSVALESVDTDLGAYAVKFTHTGGVNVATDQYIDLPGLANNTAYTVKYRFKRLSGSNNWSMQLEAGGNWSSGSAVGSHTTSYAEYTLTGTTAASGTPKFRVRGTSSADGGDSFLISMIFVQL